MTIDEAFWRKCAEAEIPMRWSVSLYSREQWYGGPEEGGWWGYTVVLQGYVVFPTRQEAEDRCKAVEDFARQKTKEEHDAWTRQCLAECEYAEARMVEPESIYGEPDGPTEWFVCVEQTAGSQAYKTNPQYC